MPDNNLNEANCEIARLKWLLCTLECVLEDSKNAEHAWFVAYCAKSSQNSLRATEARTASGTSRKSEMYYWKLLESTLKEKAQLLGDLDGE